MRAGYLAAFLFWCGCAHSPVAQQGRAFSCHANLSGTPNPEDAQDLVTLVYPLINNVPPEQVAQALCEQVLTPLGRATVVGRGVSVRERGPAHQAVAKFMRAIDQPEYALP